MRNYYRFVFSLASALFLLPVIATAQLVVKGNGMGRTTDHIATLTVTNNSANPVYILPQTVYIPSSGTYQPYVGRIPGGTVVPSGATAQVPVIGYCTDVHKPPVSNGSAMDPTTWVPVGEPGMVPGRPPGLTEIVTLINNKPLPFFYSEQIPTLTGAPGFSPSENPAPGTITATWPGTDIPMGGTLNPNSNPSTFAPVIVAILEQIENAVDHIQQNPSIITPYAADPEREREALIQQTFWVSMGLVTGKNYTRGDFTNNVYEQFENTAGAAVTTLPKEEKEKVEQGVNQFWSAFMATGMEAKVLSETEPATPIANPEEPETPPAEEVEGSPCELEIEVRADPPYELDYAIAGTGTQEMNERTREAFRAAIAEVAGIATDAERSDDVDVSMSTPEMPASAWSVWIPAIVMGRANASAMVVSIDNPLNSSWTTEPIQSSADGTFRVTLRHQLGKDCRSTLVGVNAAKLRAGSGMNATLGNVEFLRAVNFVGELAIDFLISRGKGTAKKLSKYLAEKAKDLAKDEAKKLIKEELLRLREQTEGMTPEEADQTLEELFEEIRTGEEAEEESDVVEDWIADLLVEGEDFNPLEKIEGDIVDNVDSPVDWAPIKTNTYALAEGKLQIWVDELTADASAASGVRYKREELEDEEETVRGGGVFCEEARVSKSTSGTITLKTQGTTASYAGATGGGIISTGHGIATATLESFNGLYVVAICECPDRIYYDTWASSTGHSTDEIMIGVWTRMFENMMNEATDAHFGTLGPADFRLPRNFAEDLKDRLNHAADSALDMILKCREE